MKKFKFNLEKVLGYRHLQQDLAERDFLEAQNNLNIELQNLQNMILLKKQSIEQRSQQVGASQTWSQSVDQINQFLLGQDLRIKNQNLRLLELEKVVESKREILRKATVEAKIIDKLKEKKFEEFNREVDRKEQNELDELSALRFSRNENPLKGSHEDGI